MRFAWKTPRKRPQQVEILLVEDSPDEAYLIGECFTEAKIDHTLHNVEDGASAVEFLINGAITSRPRDPTSFSSISTCPS